MLLMLSLLKGMGWKVTVTHAVSAYLALGFHKSGRSPFSGLMGVLVTRGVHRLDFLEYSTLEMRYR